MKELSNELLVCRFENIVRQRSHIWTRYNIYAEHAKDSEMKSYWLDQFNKQCNRVSNIKNLLINKLAC